MNISPLIFAIAPFAIFLALYVRVRFWKNLAGISVFVMALMVVIVLALVLARVAGWVPPAHVRELIYALVGVAGWVQLCVYLYTRRGFRRDYANRKNVRSTDRMTESDRPRKTGGDEPTKDADLDPNEALIEPSTADVPDDTPDPDVAEVTDPDDPSFVEPATPPGGAVQ